MPCDPSPCKNMGICQAVDTSAVCHCTEYFKGQFCETGVIKTPPFPIVYVQKLSSSRTLSAISTVDLSISIICDASVALSPNKVTIGPNMMEASFKVKSSSDGLFKVDYSIPDGSGFEKPKQGLLLALMPGNSPDMTYFQKNDLLTGILKPGCCTKSTSFHLSYCAENVQNITISSSCSFISETDNIYKTRGVSFIHSGDLALPLSLAGLDSMISPTTLDLSVLAENDAVCEFCTISEDCIAANTSSTDIRDMLREQSLIKTFLHAAHSIIPSSINIIVPDIEQNEKASLEFYPYHFIASLTKPLNVDQLSGCEELQMSSSGVAYILRAYNKFDVNISGSEISYALSENDNPLCFGLNLCEEAFSPLFIGISAKLSELILSTEIFDQFNSEGWSINVSRCLMSVTGVSFVSDEKFWNGSELIMVNVPLYDVGLYLKAIGSLKALDQNISLQISGDMFFLMESKVG